MIIVDVMEHSQNKFKKRRADFKTRSLSYENMRNEKINQRTAILGELTEKVIFYF